MTHDSLCERMVHPALGETPCRCEVRALDAAGKELLNANVDLAAKVVDLEARLAEAEKDEDVLRAQHKEIFERAERAEALVADAQRYHDERNEAMGWNDHLAQTCRELTEALRKQNALVAEWRPVVRAAVFWNERYFDCYSEDALVSAIDALSPTAREAAR